VIISFSDLLTYGLVSTDRETNCMLWGRTKFENGYGRYKDKRAHRVSWELNYGPISNSLLVLHSCDIRACINPEHLFLGTQLDNMRDMISKGRKVVVAGYDNYSTTDEYKQKVSGENHWTKRNPDRIANGDRHWSRTQPEKFSELSKNGKYKPINIEEKKGSE
jgi:hypothetical protein